MLFNEEINEIIMPEEHENQVESEDDNQIRAESILPSDKAPQAQEQEPHDTHNESLCFTDDKPCREPEGRNLCNGEEHLYLEEDFPKYQEDIFPEGSDVKKLTKKYKAMPEEYYSRSASTGNSDQFSQVV